MASGESQRGSLNCNGTQRQMWLAKIPKYMADQWRQNAGAPEVGRLRSGKDRNNKKQFIFHSTAPYARPATGDIPSQHEFVISSTDQSIGLLAEDRSVSDTKPSQSMVGHVARRIICRPSEGDQVYMKMKVKHFEQVSKPKQIVRQLERSVVNFKPVSKHEHHMGQKSRKDQREARERVRVDKDTLRNLVFELFEKHQYYSMKDVTDLTKQPQTAVREVLTEICDYNKSAQHRNMYELKREYRHYNEGEGAEEAGAT